MAELTYRPYTRAEIHAAARKKGIDPYWFEALYMVESSNGKNKTAMGVQKVQRKKDTTFVRGPFQLEDDTVADYYRRNKMPPDTDISDPLIYLDVAAGIGADKVRQAGGDYGKGAQRYLGRGKDQFGTTTSEYERRVMAARAQAMEQGEPIDTEPMAQRGPFTPDGATPMASPLDTLSPFMHGADAGEDSSTFDARDIRARMTPAPSAVADSGDMFGLPSDMLQYGSLPDVPEYASGGGYDNFDMSGIQPSTRRSDMGIGSWKDFLASARSGHQTMPEPVGLGIPEEMAGDWTYNGPPSPAATDIESINNYLSGLVDEQMKDKEFHA